MYLKLLFLFFIFKSWWGEGEVEERTSASLAREGVTVNTVAAASEARKSRRLTMKVFVVCGDFQLMTKSLQKKKN